MNVCQVFLNRMFDSERDAVAGDTLVRSTRLLLMIHLAAGHIVRFAAIQPMRSAAMVALCLIAINARWQRAAIALAIPLQIYNVHEKFPNVANHLWIETLMLVVLLMLGDSEEDNTLYRQFACWLSFIVLFYTGLQKLWYGTYFDGQYLATKIALFHHFRDFFAIVVPQQEIERLQSYVPIQAGSGPFLINSLPYLVVINSVWITEMLAGVLLFFRRTRMAGFVFGMFVIIGIEVVAREIFFGVLFVAILLAFLRADYVRRLLLPATLLYVYLICVHYFTWLPRFTFYP